MNINIAIDDHGPLFDGRAQKAIEDGTRDIERTISTLGASMVRSELNRVLRVQTPYYRMQVTTRKQAYGTDITDRGVIYGPWLEGVGSRNRTTRFKGYATFRRMVVAINARAKAIGEQVMAKYMGRMQ